jgi:hypothetical protein
MALSCRIWSIEAAREEEHRGYRRRRAQPLQAKEALAGMQE